MSEDLRKRQDTNDLPPDEAYVVTRMREAKILGDQSMLRADPNGRPLLCVGPVPVCTFDTLFRMLGHGVLELDDTAPRADRWKLMEEWQ